MKPHCIEHNISLFLKRIESSRMEMKGNLPLLIWNVVKVIGLCHDNDILLFSFILVVSVLASSVVDRGFEPWSVKLVFVASPLSTQH